MFFTSLHLSKYFSNWFFLLVVRTNRSKLELKARRLTWR